MWHWRSQHANLRNNQHLAYEQSDCVACVATITRENRVFSNTQSKISVCNMKPKTHRFVSAAIWNMQTTDAELNPLSQTPASLHIQLVAFVPLQTPLLCFVPSAVKSSLAFFLSPLSFFHPLPHLSCTSAWIFPGCLPPNPQLLPRPPRPHSWRSQVGQVRAIVSGGRDGDEGFRQRWRAEGEQAAGRKGEKEAAAKRK